jgi:hypothetical protein
VLANLVSALLRMVKSIAKTEADWVTICPGASTRELPPAANRTQNNIVSRMNGKPGEWPNFDLRDTGIVEVI